MPAEYILFLLNGMTLFHAFREKMFLLLLKNYKVVAIKRYSIKDRELIFAVLDRLVNCLCGSIKD